MSARRKVAEARLDAAELKTLHEFLDEIRAALGIASSEDPLAATRQLVADSRRAADQLKSERQKVADLEAALATARAQHQALRDTGHELQSRNREMTTLLAEAGVLLGDLAAEVPPHMRVRAMELRGTSNVGDQLPMDARERIVVTSLLALRNWQSQVGELAGAGQVDRIPF